MNMNRLANASLLLLVLHCDAFVAQVRPSTWSRLPTLYSTSTRTLPEGLIKSIQTPGDGPLVSFGDICTLSYSCYVLEDDGSSSQLFAKAPAQKYMIGDGSMVDAWEKVLPTMRVGERSIVRVNDPKLGYGNAGVPPVVPPNAMLEFDIEVLNAMPATANIDFDTIAMADKTPKTAAEIEAAFARKMAAKSDEPQLEGFELFLKKAKNFYFFGLFEGETGERPPWILRPSITFPLAFAVVGAAFYISYTGGAISERGAQVKDELDEIILSMNGVNAGATNMLTVVALMTSFLVNLNF